MKVSQLISHTHLIKGQYITVTDLANNIEYSSQSIGRYDFGVNQDTIMALTVETFEPTSYGLHIHATGRIKR